MRTLVIGADGQIGFELCRALAGRCEVTAARRDDLDLADPASIRRGVERTRPEVIVNAAGYTDVDGVEAQSERAQRINGIGPGILARCAARCGALLVHYSSDYVFDGRAHRPYLPDDAPAPLNAYGRSKLAGEEAIVRTGARALILRTSWVYSMRRRNFLTAILRQAESQPVLRVVHDQVGCPTPARVIAEATARILRSVTEEPGLVPGPQLQHLSCQGWTSWHGFACAILELAGPRPAPQVVPIASAEYASRAERPAFSALDCRDLEDRFGLCLSQWRDALARVLAQELALSGREPA
jgi:dTDP-4-dehydrorhamnose reductase